MKLLDIIYSTGIMETSTTHINLKAIGASKNTVSKALECLLSSRKELSFSHRDCELLIFTFVLGFVRAFLGR